MNWGSITDVAGIRVGHHHRLDPDATMGSGWASGSTVVVAPPATIGAVDVRGGAPGSRETELLDPDPADGATTPPPWPAGADDIWDAEIVD